MNYTLLVALIAALSGPLLAYLAAARRLSGKIKTSEAADLWDEASNLRTEYREEAARLRLEIGRCHERIAAIELHNSKLHKENGELLKIIAEHEKTIELLKRENNALKVRIEELEKRN